MTAEIVIMNKEAVALAADSAVVTTEERGPKIFTSANKIFALSRHYPVGIMVYGTADFMGVPWETIIKIYRSKLKNKKFDILKQYSDDFLKFLIGEKQLFPESEQKEHFKRYVYSYFFHIKEEIEKEVFQLIAKNKKASINEIKDLTTAVIKIHYKRWKDANNMPNLPKNYKENLKKKFGKIMDNAKRDTFEKLPLTNSLSELLTEIALNLFSKFPEEISPPSLSGVVITGFGDKDIFPSLQSYLLEGIVDNVLQYKEFGEQSVTLEKVAIIRPFAQQEMVYTFMEGVSPDYEQEIEKYFSQVCYEYPKIIIDSIHKLNKEEKTELKEKFIKISKDWLIKYRKRLIKFREIRYTDPITAVVAMLPKDELAAMAESLINLTSFKRRVTIEAETVGGPIDVAVISKGDGFIWIKRKHYFKPELNPQFFTKYKKETKDGGNDKKK